MWLACVPLFHISGLSIVMRSVIYGMPMLIHEKFDPEAANRAICEEGVTVVSVVSNMLSRMIDALGDSAYPPHFRCMLLGGGPAPLPLLEACRGKNIPVFQTYGMTETASQIVTLPPEFMLSKLGSAGKPLFLSELRIAQDGKDAAPFAAGEIVVRGPNVTKGYLNRPEATAAAIRGGWLYTGDIGYVDEEGFLYVLDRRSDLIISGGENVYPAEIEAVLLGHPAIAEAGVTGLEDKEWGQVPAAFVKLKEGAALSEQEVLDHCAGKLAKYKIPKRVYFVDKLPRSAANKLLRRELRTLIR
jgi:O-succinylbenzoic acid--CoA ligase